MKLYVASNTKSGTDNIEGLYFLLAETGELIEKWVSSNKYYAMIDLYGRNKETQKICKEKFGDNIEVVFLGSDDMTQEKLKELNRKFNNS